MLPRPDSLHLLRCKDVHRRPAGIIELTHRLLIDRADIMQGLHRFVDGGERVTAIISSHLSSPLQSTAAQA